MREDRVYRGYRRVVGLGERLREYGSEREAKRVGLGERLREYRSGREARRVGLGERLGEYMLGECVCMDEKLEEWVWEKG